MESSTNISRSHGGGLNHQHHPSSPSTTALQSPQHVALLRSSTSTLPYINGSNNVVNNNNHINNSPAVVANMNINNNVNGSVSLPRGFKADRFEIPLPFGYHLDLDFLRFCNDDTLGGSAEDTLEKLKDLRRERRQQRKTLEALMGYKQEQRKRKLEARSLSSPPLRQQQQQRGGEGVPPNHTSTLTVHTTRGRTTPDLLNHSEFMKEALTDFELCLEGGGPNKISSFDLIHGSKEARAKFNTLPKDGLCRQTSNSSLSSISTNSSALPYVGATSPVSPEASVLLAGLPSSVPPAKHDSMETDSIVSISSEMSATTLRNVREQMARSLVKLKEYEKQVEAIPVMQVKLSVLKEEKRLLMLKLKQRELQLRRQQVCTMY